MAVRSVETMVGSVPEMLQSDELTVGSVADRVLSNKEAL